MATFQTVPRYGQTVTDSMGRTGIAKFNPNTSQPLAPPVSDTSSIGPGPGDTISSNARVFPMGGAQNVDGSTNPVGGYTAGDPSSGGNRSLTGGMLAGDLNQGFLDSPQYQSILGAYNASRDATAANTQATGRYIQNVTGGNTDYEKLQTGVDVQSSMESRRGFATNVAMLTNLQAQGAQRVKQLTDQANNALMANNAAGAAALTDLAVKEQTAITDARTQFLSNYFSSQAEVRTQTGFQTPEQQQVIALSALYPDSGITPADTLAQAQQKISKGSAMYTAGLAGAQQTALATAAQKNLYGAQAGEAGAAAGLSRAQTEQTRTLTGYLGGSDGSSISPSDPDVQALLNHTITPEQLQAKYAGLPGGFGGARAAAIISAAQRVGYDVNTSTLLGQGQASQTGALNSGNPLNVLGGAASQFYGSLINQLQSPARELNSTESSVSTQVPTNGADGSKYGYPGYTFSSSRNGWVKIK